MGNLARLGFTDLPDWHPQGACNGRSDLDWYGETSDEIAAVKAVCAVCPVQAVCLQDALDRREPWGVWGGLAPAERDSLAEGVGAVVATISRHGERSRYMGSRTVPGCRCELCTRAHADYEHARRVEKAARGPNWTPPQRLCAECAAAFIPRTGESRFCGKRCAEVANKRRERAKTAARAALRRCAVCEGPMPRQRHRYCDDDCRDLAAISRAQRRAA